MKNGIILVLTLHMNVCVCMCVRACVCRCVHVHLVPVCACVYDHTITPILLTVYFFSSTQKREKNVSSLDRLIKYHVIVNLADI